MGDYIMAAAIIILFCGGLAYISYRGYKKSKRAKRAKEATATRLGATMSGTLKHVSGLPLAKGLTVEMFYGPDKIVFKKDGQEICQSTVARRAENGSARSFFRNGSPWASICGTYSKGERRCW